MNTHIQAIFKECCIIMDKKNNKFRDQKESDRQRNPPKKNLPRLKGPFQVHKAEKKNAGIKIKKL